MSRRTSRWTYPDSYLDYAAREIERDFGRFGTAEEVARVAAFLASPAASWVTGTNISVDGGQHKGVD